jgi:transposase InsO family protein
VARQTVHAWLARYAAGGLAGLADRSSRPASCPHQMPAEVEARIAGLRREHPGWGPSRILRELERAGVAPLPGRSAVYRALVRHGLVDPRKRKRRREDYRRWERGRAMQLWQMDVMGRVHLAGGQEVKVVTGIDDHSRFVVCAKVVVAATARPVCLALAEALRRHGIPGQILTDNGKVFTARFGRGPGPVMSGRICAGNGIRHLLTAPYSPATTGKAGRLHKTMRAEFFTPKDGSFTTVEELQAAVDGWVSEYNTARPHQSCGGRPPIERFRLADRSITPDASAAAPILAQVTAAAAGRRPAGVSRWVNAHGKISLAGFSYAVGATYAGEPAGARGSGRPGGHPARRGRGRHPRTANPRGPGQPDAPGPGRPPGQGRDRRADRLPARRRRRSGQLRRHALPSRAKMGPHRHRRRHRRRLGAAVQGRPGHPRPPHPPRPLPRARRLRQPQRPAPPQELRHRKHRLTVG